MSKQSEWEYLKKLEYDRSKTKRPFPASRFIALTQSAQDGGQHDEQTATTD